MAGDRRGETSWGWAVGFHSWDREPSAGYGAKHEQSFQSDLRCDRAQRPQRSDRVTHGKKHGSAANRPGKISPASCRRPGAHCRPLDPASLSLSPPFYKEKMN